MPNHCNAPLFYLNNNNKKKSQVYAFREIFWKLKGVSAWSLSPAQVRSIAALPAADATALGLNRKILLIAV